MSIESALCMLKAAVTGQVALANLFDQYSQPENRFTHALLTALHEDRTLLDRFLRELVGVKPPVKASRLSVLEQRFPGEEEPREEEEFERRGIPDGWIFDNEGWCVFIETKVLAAFRASQIEDHRRTALRRGFRRVTPVVITALTFQKLPPGAVHLEWSVIYAWLHKHASRSTWAARVAEFLETPFLGTFATLHWQRAVAGFARVQLSVPIDRQSRTGRSLLLRRSC